MLTRAKLVELYRELRDRRVLSIYLDGTGDDPAERKVWRKELEHLVGDARSGIEEAGGEDLEEFEGALRRLRKELDQFDAFLPGRGWVGFATADRAWYAASVPVPMPNLVRWEAGLRVAPFVRALKQARPVIVVLLDSRRARIFTYRNGEVEEHTDLRADTFLGDLTDVTMPKRAATSSGMRGKTGTDAAQKFLEVGSERMRARLVEVLAEKLGDQGFLVIGGTPEAVSALAQQVPRGLADRVAERPSLYLDMSAAEVRDAAEEAASELSRSLQRELLTEVMDLARSDGKGCLGREATRKALLEGRVDTLLVARSFREEDPDFVDHCVGSAFEQQAAVEELSADEAQRLRSEGEGIGARLRYTL